MFLPEQVDVVAPSAVDPAVDHLETLMTLPAIRGLARPPWTESDFGAVNIGPSPNFAECRYLSAVQTAGFMTPNDDMTFDLYTVTRAALRPTIRPGPNTSAPPTTRSYRRSSLSNFRRGCRSPASRSRSGRYRSIPEVGAGKVPPARHGRYGWLRVHHRDREHIVGAGQFHVRVKHRHRECRHLRAGSPHLQGPASAGSVNCGSGVCDSGGGSGWHLAGEYSYDALFQGTKVLDSTGAP